MNASLRFRSAVVLAYAAMVTLCCAGHEPDGFTDAESIKAFLHSNFDGKSIGMVIGLVDEQGNRLFAAGNSDLGSHKHFDGDSIFEIGSVTKTFTTLLLRDSVRRAEVKLEDPVSKFLPQTVKIESWNGREMTLLDLATHTSGLPENPDNFSPGDPNEAYSKYSVDQMYAFLSKFKLSREPGTKWEYSNLGMALLANIVALRTRADYETLVADRICRPLRMESTRITLTDEMKNRVASNHDSGGRKIPDQNFDAMTGASALHSTANDLLKYLAANLGLDLSTLARSMEQTHLQRSTAPPKHLVTAMDWYDHGINSTRGTNLLGHAGQTVGSSAFIGFDKSKRRGVVVLFNQQTGGGLSADAVGWALLEGTRLTPKSAAVLFAGKRDELVGIGVTLELDAKRHAFKVTKVFPNSPASAAGFTVGVIIQKVDGLSTESMTMTECLGLVRGAPGSKVRLELAGPFQPGTRTVEVVRQKIPM